MMTIPKRKLRRSNGEKTGKTKILTTILQPNLKKNQRADLCICYEAILQYLRKQQRAGLMTNNKVAYFYNDQIGNFYYHKDHPMKPRRITMAHSLIQSFNLYQKLDIYNDRHATRDQLLKFHHPDYINYLSNFVSKDILTSRGFMYTNDMMLKTEQQRKSLVMSTQKKSQFSMGQNGDCPGFSGLYQFCQLSCGGSIDSAYVLLNQDANIAINWGGGLHHAKKCQASGFCYTNDIVLAILQLLKYHKRVLYLDVDVHHGDGVQEAFYVTDRVMTVSFHQYGQDFFPGTGNIDAVGEGPGKYYALNIPLKVGIDDDTYHDLFDCVMDEVIAKYRPESVVLQLGADSLAHDVLGRLNLSIKGHGHCVKKMMSYGIPLMLLGGGGYTVQNVARCWVYETGVALGQQLQGSIPKTDRFYESYFPDYRLHLTVKQTKNKNTPEYIHELKQKVFQHLRHLDNNPGVPFHNIPTMAFRGERMQDQNEKAYDKSLSTLVRKRGDMDD